MRIYFKGKLLKDGVSIDDNIEGFVDLVGKTRFASFFNVTGEINTSKSLPPHAILFIDPSPPQFELILDKPIIENKEETSRFPIRFTSVDEEDRKKAIFRVGVQEQR